MEVTRSGIFIQLRTVLLLGVLLLNFTSCSDEGAMDSLDPGYGFFPLEIGQKRFYTVDSIILDPGPGGVTRDTERIFLMELTTDTFRHPEGRLLFSVEQYTRRADSLPWMLDRVVFRCKDSYQAESWEGGLRFVDLSFPLFSDKQWDGLAFINPATPVFVAGERLFPFTFSPFRVVGIGEGFLTDGGFFGETCTVEAGLENLIEFRKWKSVYAKGVGLVFREIEVLDSQVLDAELGWNEKAEKGFILRQSLYMP